MANLQRELEQVTRINEVVGKLLTAVQSAGANIAKFEGATSNTNNIVDKWMHILSQTQFTRDTITDADWDGEDIDISAKEQREEALRAELEQLERENEALRRKM